MYLCKVGFFYSFKVNVVLNFGLETNTYLFVFKGPGQPLFFYCFILFSTVFILTDFKAEAFRVF